MEKKKNCGEKASIPLPVCLRRQKVGTAEI